MSKAVIQPEKFLNKIFKISKHISPKAVEAFADLAVDHNPLHLNPDFASQTSFKKPIAHGMLSASLFSGAISSNIRSAVYLKQNLKFLRPVFVGETVEAEVAVVSERQSHRGVKLGLRTRVLNQSGDVVIDGEAEILVPNDHKERD